MYRAATVVLNGLTPNDRGLADTLMEWMGDALGGLISKSRYSFPHGARFADPTQPAQHRV